ncbi:MAG: nicotinate-nucleotide adenylyltransferase [Caulobacteraceae bacterium]|nr:nicotinate-nucleotide adenylyltransferase [Caulobacter sp.]
MWIAGPARARPAAGRPHALRLGLHLEPGLRVGLFGGSFNPAHDGHAHVAETARVRLKLDRVVWLVSPQNPLKLAHETASLPERMASARSQARGPSMIVSDAETRLGSPYTLDTVLALKARFPRVRFVWIMGADNLGAFHRWRGWTQIMRELPVAVIARPGALLLSRTAPMARRFASARRPSREAPALADMAPPAWIYLRAPLNPASSTALRARLRAAATLDASA